MPLFKNTSDIKSVLNELLPKEFYSLGDVITNYLETKQGLENAIVLVNFQNVIAKRILKVSCDVIFKQNGVPMQQKNFLETVVSVFDMPQYIHEGINNGQIESIKLGSEDLESLFVEKTLSMEKSKKWNEVQKSCLPYSKRINLTDRVFYTLVECYNGKEEKINALRIGVIDDLPDNLSKELYPGKSYQFVL